MKIHEQTLLVCILSVSLLYTAAAVRCQRVSSQRFAIFSLTTSVHNELQPGAVVDFDRQIVHMQCTEFIIDLMLRQPTSFVGAAATNQVELMQTSRSDHVYGSTAWVTSRRVSVKTTLTFLSRPVIMTVAGNGIDNDDVISSSSYVSR
jgi:hypothetical protein